MRKINATLHGIFDYLIVTSLYSLPTLLGAKSTHSKIGSAFGSLFLVTNLTTRYPLSTAKIVPFPIHGAMEALAGFSLLGMALMPKIQSNGRLFYAISALQLLTLVATSNYADKSLTVESLFAEPATQKS